MIDLSNVFKIKRTINTGSAKTMLQIKCNAPFVIEKIKITQPDNVSQRATFALCYKSGAATVTAAAVGTGLIPHVSDATHSFDLATNGTGYDASAEGTNGNELWRDDFDVRIGSLEVSDEASDKKGYKILQGEIVALRGVSIPAAHDWTCEITVRVG